MKATFLFSDDFLTRFAQDADVFEPFKVLIKTPVKAQVDDNFGQSNVDAIIKKCEKSPYKLIAVVVDNGFQWFHPNVKVVSDGTHWCKIEDYLGI